MQLELSYVVDSPTPGFGLNKEELYQHLTISCGEQTVAVFIQEEGKNKDALYKAALNMFMRIVNYQFMKEVQNNIPAVIYKVRQDLVSPSNNLIKNLINGHNISYGE